MFYLSPDRECITTHSSLTESIKILKIYHLSTESSFVEKDGSIQFTSGMKGAETMTMTASSDIEHKHWCYALDVALARLRKETTTIIPPPHFPVHSGTLLYLDDSMKWKKTYVVMTEDCIYFHEHRRNGFGTPVRHFLTPNAMIFATTLNEHSFEVRTSVNAISQFCLILLLIIKFSSCIDHATSLCCFLNRFT